MPETNLKPIDSLIKKGILSREQLSEAEVKAKLEGNSIESYLVKNNIVSASEMVLAVAEYLDILPITLKRFIGDQQLLDLIPIDIMRRYKVIPVSCTGKLLTLAMGDPYDIVAIDQVAMHTGCEVVPVIAAESEIEEALNKLIAKDIDSINMEEIMKEDDENLEVNTVEESAEIQNLEEAIKNADDQPIVRMVNMILMEAIRLGANDVHIEPQADHVRLRYRVDGTLIERPSLPKSIQSAIVSRIKVLSDLDIGEQRLPQDSRFRVSSLGKTIDVRVSILPTIFGGRVVLRLLDKNALFPNLASLGLEGRAYEVMKHAIEQPHGIILVTGPTGSGKTTTLYSCLQELNTPDVNITTCEDPVEYQIPGINQVKINPDVGCTFAAALRAILRQDPDIVLIGEIRDAETCDIAIKAALTGHLVLSTLHANDAAGAITRLLDMGMEPFLVASAVILTQAQRLYKKLCTVCKQPVEPNLKLLEEYGIDPHIFDGVNIYGPKGCPKCHNIGYKGRSAIMEVLPIDDDIRSGIMKNYTSDQLREIAVKNGMKTLLDEALDRVKAGLTTLEVALRIAGSG